MSEFKTHQIEFTAIENEEFAARNGTSQNTESRSKCCGMDSQGRRISCPNFAAKMLLCNECLKNKNLQPKVEMNVQLDDFRIKPPSSYMEYCILMASSTESLPDCAYYCYVLPDTDPPRVIKLSVHVKPTTAIPRLGDFVYVLNHTRSYLGRPFNITSVCHVTGIRIDKTYGVLVNVSGDGASNTTTDYFLSDLLCLRFLNPGEEEPLRYQEYTVDTLPN